MNKTLEVVAILVLIVLFVTLTYLSRKTRKNEQTTGNVDFYGDKYTFTVGTLVGYGDYNFVVVKGDSTRYDYEIGPNHEIILGSPIDIELAQRLDAWEALEDYAKKNDPIGSNPVSAEQIKLLEDAGFSVEENE